MMLSTLETLPLRSLQSKKRAALNRSDDPALPAMTKDELECFRRYLSKAKNYLEFGCGGSTRLAAKAENIDTIWSVESDAIWVENLKKEIDADRVTFQCPDLGPIGKWGIPTDREKRSEWPRYHSEIWELLDPSTLDLVLIDGRFRVACVMQTVLRVKADCTIMIHDFWNRPKYHHVLPFLNEKERVDSFGVFEPGEPKLVSDVQAALARFSTDWR